jgi:hypothetical protein
MTLITSTAQQPDRLSVAPMMDWTDRHCRYFHRLLTRRALLYTEMVTTGALLHGDVPRHLRFNVEEHPLALQLGGSEPADLAQAARLGEQWGYDEINLNCGCPSERVQRGAFGACLMAFVSSAAASAHATWRAAARASCRVLNPAAAAFAARLVSAQLSRARFFSFSFEMAIASLKLAGSMRCHATRDAHEALDHDRVGHLRSLGLALFCARRVHLVLELEGLGSPARIVGVWAIRRVCPVLKVTWPTFADM